jgi:ABC-type antimicrobial peptide transport system permease subunit
MFIDAVILHYKSPQPNVEQTVRRTLASIDPNLTITNLRTYDDQVAGNFIQERLLARLTSLFGILALILASVGLYGVQSYLVARRTGEIGIRMALGATRSSVLANVMRSALVLIVFGLAVGIVFALFAGHLMATQLYGVGGYDPWAFIGATCLLAASAVLASLVPARRAASIEPMQALRTE